MASDRGHLVPSPVPYPINARINVSITVPDPTDVKEPDRPSRSGGATSSRPATPAPPSTPKVILPKTTFLGGADPLAPSASPEAEDDDWEIVDTGYRLINDASDVSTLADFGRKPAVVRIHWFLRGEAGRDDKWGMRRKVPSPYDIGFSGLIVLS